MNSYVNAEEVIRIAITIEENGHTFYQSALKEIHSPSIKKQLHALAVWEDGHVAKMKEMLKSVTGPADEFPLFFSPEEDTSLYINAVADQHIFIQSDSIDSLIKNCQNPLELLNLALRFENDSVNFYTSLAEKVVDPESKKAIQAIADEEIAHVSQIKKIILEETQQ